MCSTPPINKILFPPYDDNEGRDCNYYKASESQDPTAPIYLTLINQPDHFHCLSGEYGRFTACDVDVEEDVDMVDMGVCVDTVS